MSAILRVIILAVVIVTAASELSLSALIDGLRHPPTRTILRRHCTNLQVVGRNLDTTAPSSDVELHCKDLSTETLMVKKCHDGCFDPIRCIKMVRYLNKPIVQASTVTDRSGNEYLIHLPVGCNCVVKSKHHRFMRNCLKKRSKFF